MGAPQTREDVLTEVAQRMGMGVPNSFLVTNYAQQVCAYLLAELVADLRNKQRNQGDSDVRR